MAKKLLKLQTQNLKWISVYLTYKVDTKSQMYRWTDMKNIHSIEFYTGSKEELLPDFEKDFPYIASRAELDKYIGGYVPVYRLHIWLFWNNDWYQTDKNHV